MRPPHGGARAAQDALWQDPAQSAEADGGRQGLLAADPGHHRGRGRAVGRHGAAGDHWLRERGAGYIIVGRSGAGTFDCRLPEWLHAVGAIKYNGCQFLHVP